ncbi:MAG: hypothetical protein SH821_07090 [Phototrophicales bacterium]|nr:hypothetical protein [Phototrophicales bacterium]
MKKLFVLFISLFIMVNGAVFAQENDDEKDGSQDVVTGSVSSSAYYSVPTGGKPGEIQPMQVNGGIEARAELWWSTAPICTYFNCWMQGKAVTQVVSGSGVYNLCAQVIYLSRNGVAVGSTGFNCGTYNLGNGVSAETQQNGDPRAANWIVATAHTATNQAGVGGTPFNWAPFLSASVNL